ncbi:MAG: DUF3127 domain-containing protein [Bacteroidetes bacterium]|nr:DUF3127 domain-containing protein [Bacteroidota bacterium]
MELSGKVITILPLQTGTGKNGTWKKQEFVVETTGQVPRKVCFNLWGEKIDQFKLSEGIEVRVSFDLESREYNGKWYTDVKAWKVEKVQKTESESIPENLDGYQSDVPPDEPLPHDDLPF